MQNWIKIHHKLNNSIFRSVNTSKTYYICCLHHCQNLSLRKPYSINRVMYLEFPLMSMLEIIIISWECSLIQIISCYMIERGMAIFYTSIFPMRKRVPLLKILSIPEGTKNVYIWKRIRSMTKWKTKYPGGVFK